MKSKIPVSLAAMFAAAALALLVSSWPLTKPSLLTASRSESWAPRLSPARTDAAVAPQLPNQARLVQNYGRLPLSFEVNQGQSDPQVKFLSRGRGYALFLTSGEAVLSLRGRRKSDFGSPMSGNGRPDSPAGTFPTFGRLLEGPQSLKVGHALFERRCIKGHQAPSVLRMKLVGANANAKVAGLEELPGKANYFIGNDPKKWRTNVATYAKVKYKDVYPGVDLVYYGNEGKLEYDFVVAPGADPRAIAFGIETGKSSTDNLKSKMRRDADGDLVVEADSGEVRFHKPVVYQEQWPVTSDEWQDITDHGRRTTDALSLHSSPGTRHFLEGRYVLTADNGVRFEVPRYDKSRPLVIDPVLSYSTYLGGSANDFGLGITVDSSGNAYVVGDTGSTNFPTVNPFQASLKGTSSAFVTKINAAGTALMYSTYLGGSGNFDRGEGIAVDSSGNAYVAGTTDSTDFPTANPFQATCGGGCAFVTKFNAAGSALVYSTYLGGSINNFGHGISVDSLGNAYVTGGTSSTDFPTVNPFQATCGNCAGGFENAFVTKFNAAGSALVYSTFLGGSGNNNSEGRGIAIDSSGNAYVTGFTFSTNFPTANAFQARCGGSCNGNAFVTKFNAAGSALVYSTYLGGSGGEDFASGIAVDSSGNAYVTGGTSSTDFPTVNPFQATCGGGCAFVTKFNAAGSALVYSTFLGGSVGRGIAVDSSGNAYVAGAAGSTNFPVVNAFQARCGGSCNGNAFVTKFNTSGSALVYSTYLGGSGDDSALGIAVDSSGNAYVAGAAGSTNFPVVNAIQSTSGGPSDGFVAKISTPVTLSPPGPFAPEVVGTTSSAQAVSLTNTSGASLNISGIAANGDFAVATNGTTCSTSSPLAVSANCTIDVTFTPTTSGSRTGALTITDSAGDSPQMAVLVGTGEDFGVAVASGSSSSATVTSGQSATYTISVMPQGGFNQMVTLNCSGAPFAATCTPSPTSVTLDGTNSQNVTVTVTTTKRGTLPPVAVPHNLPRGWIALRLFVCLIALMFLAQLVRRRQLRPQLAFALLILCAIAWAGCGSSGPPGTPAGTSTLTVTANSGSLSHKTTVTLTVN